MNNELETNPVDILNQLNPSAYDYTRDIVTEEIIYLTNDMMKNPENYFDGESLNIPKELREYSIVKSWVQDLLYKAIQDSIEDILKNVNKKKGI
jgi:hypothetical protein